MPSRSYIHSRSGSRDGIALVTVLAFIVLLTILVVSFISFTRLNRSATGSYSNAIQTQEIARGGLIEIINDFHQEIVAGSTAQNGGSTSYAPVYVPTANWTAQPARLGYAPGLYTNDLSPTYLPSTLVRVSRADPNGGAGSTALYPPLTAPNYNVSALPLNRASPASTSAASVNGRAISPARWNKIDLLSTNSIIPVAFSTNTPDWVYVTRTGSRVCTTTEVQNGDLRYSNNVTQSYTVTAGQNPPASPVVGRYAYAVYDEGALLDANSAGYISAAINSYTSASPTTIYTNSVTGISQVITGKTYTAYADMTQLPGLSGAQSVIDNLITWRNASGNLIGSSAGVNFYQTVFSNALNGFLKFQSNANGITDSPLLGRQDLINYFANLDLNGGTSYSSALPYLGTFTRASNAPSWTPTANSSALPGYNGGSYTGISSVAYKDNAENSTVSGQPNPNRDIANVRYPASTPANTAVIHYADDGTQTTYYVNPGDPLVQHRFSLGKLSWLTYKGPSADLATSDPLYNPGGTKANIQTCFGLQWSSVSEYGNTYSCWKYAANITSPVSIQTLDQVAAGSTGTSNSGYREPNFFEMLKAGILAGSLGQTPGPLINGETASTPGTWSTTIDGVAGSYFAVYSAEKDHHILQIGANIIDQSDSDSYPTAIYLGLFTPPLPEDDLCINMVYGDENLPEISRMCAFTVEAPSKYMKMWFQPEIWNIHQAPASNVTLPNYPTGFRLHAYGKLTFTPTNNQSGNAAYPAPVPSGVMNYDDSASSYGYHDSTGAAQSTTGQQAALVYFTDPNGGTAASPFYNFPIRLDQNFPSTSSTSLTWPNNTPPVNYWGEMGLISNLPADYTTSSPSTAVTASGSLLTTASERFAGIFAGEAPIDMSQIPWTFPAPGGSPPYMYVNCYPNPSIYFSIDYEDAAGAWHPYNFMSRIKEQACFSQTYSIRTPGNPPGAPNYGTSYPVQGGTDYSNGNSLESHPDPRTDRFSSMESTAPGNGKWPVDSSVDPGYVAYGGYVTSNMQSYGPQGGTNLFPLRSYGFVYYPTMPTPCPWARPPNPYQYYSFWGENKSGNTQVNAFYLDPDGVVRPGDEYRSASFSALTYTTGSNGLYPLYSTTATSGDGNLLWNGNGDGKGAVTIPASKLPTTLAGNPTGSAQARRPLILNRPFRSVAELGYAYRDLPFKTLDFFSDESADAALLDLFCVADEPTVSAGEVNLSNAPAPVIQAILSGTNKMEINNPASANSTSGSPNFIAPADANAAASAIAASLNQNGPLSNRADIVTKLSDPLFNSLIGINSNYANKAYAEAPVRALSNVANTRTWNLLIDIIAQSGYMAPTATTLNDFVEQGERRYWLHISIDRYTGKIIDQQLEPVYE